ncbi:MAG: outer membrane lipoprotein-sorting protein, partial [Verrucomicrobiota bacterium]
MKSLCVRPSFTLSTHMMRTSILFTIISLAAATFVNADEKLLHDAEVSRGVLSANGIEWTVQGKSTSKGETTTAKLIVKAQGPHALATLVEPDTSAGKQYLLSNGEMYFFRPGAKRAVKVPKRQRVTGDASIGDLASASFLDEYQIAGTTTEKLGDEECTVFELKAKPVSRPSYSEIKIWVSNSARVSRQAHFFAASGKHLRTAKYEHNSKVTVGGKSIPFLSKLTVEELLGTPKTTTLTYTGYKFKAFPASTFDVVSMGAGT